MSILPLKAPAFFKICPGMLNSHMPLPQKFPLSRMWEPVILNYDTEQALNNKEVPERNYEPPKYISQPSSSAEVINE